MATFSQSNQYISITTPLGTDKLILRQFEGEEGVSTPFLYRVTVLSEDSKISFKNIVGLEATITVILDEYKKKRYVSGIVTRFELVAFDDREGTAFYELDLRPWLWLLNLSGHCRIFQEKTVPEIIEAVCGDAGFKKIKKKLTGTYKARDYCVQYDESDFNFVTRLMQREGIFYFFNHTSSAHELVLADDASAFAACAGVSTVKYRPSLAYDNEDNVVTMLRYAQAVTTKGYGVDSFNFETPSTDLYAKAQGSKGVGQRDIYVGDYTQATSGESYAKMLQQAAAVTGERLRGTGRLRSLVAGYKFKVTDHPRSDINQEYVLQRVQVEASTTNYVTTFEAFPSSASYRPPEVAHKPRIHSAQTAIVVGKQGEEIWVDKYGRIKVQFHWDRLGEKNEKSSCWIRVSQGWAGKSFGAMFLPRIGQEVIVSFLEGDPDQPIVTGAVYNAEQTVPYALPDNSTRSTIKSQSSKQGTGKYNEFRFEDKKGSEEIYLHAEKDMNADIINNLTTTITGNEVHSVKKGKDDNGGEKGGKRTVLVQLDETHTNEDKFTWTVAKESSTTVTGKETHKNEDDFEHTVAKNYTLKVDGNLTIEVTGDLSIKAKSIAMQSTSAAVTCKSATATTIEAGTAATIKSGTAMSIESGTSTDIKSTTAMTLNSSMGLDAKATMAFKAEGLTATVKGTASAELSASGTVTVKGAMTMIN